MTLCLTIPLNTSFLAFIFIPSLTEVHSLEACFYAQFVWFFFHALKIVALIWLIVAIRAVIGRPSGEREYM